MISLHIAMFVINDIALVILKKASDKFYASRCYSSCCGNVSTLCIGFVEQKSREAKRMDDALGKLNQL